MLLPQEDPPGWLDLLGEIMALGAIVLVGIWAYFELRVGKIVKAKVAEELQRQVEERLLKAAREEAQEETNEVRYQLESMMRQAIQESHRQLREELQKPIGEIGISEMRTEGRLSKLEAQWEMAARMLLKGSARFFKQAAEDDE
jgi:hypothetical protein